MVHAQVVDPSSGNGLCVLGEVWYAGTGHLESARPGQASIIPEGSISHAADTRSR